MRESEPRLTLSAELRRSWALPQLEGGSSSEPSSHSRSSRVTGQVCGVRLEALRASALREASIKQRGLSEAAWLRPPVSKGAGLGLRPRLWYRAFTARIGLVAVRSLFTAADP